MANGTVKWFNNAKGWGFILTEAGVEAFVHYRDVEGDGFRTLTVGDAVEFEMEESDRGPKASAVRIVEKEAESV